MATSTLYQSALAQQQKLLDALVTRYLPPEATSLKRRKVLADCQRRLKPGCAADTDPSHVEAQLRDVVTRFRIDSKLCEAQSLCSLKQELMTATIPTDVRDIHYSILRFLIHLSGDLTTTSGHISRGPRQHPKAEESDMEIDLTDEDPSSDSHESKSTSPSDLSDWTDDEPIDNDDPPPPGELDAPKEVNGLNWLAYFRPSNLSERAVVSNERYTDGSLLHCLTQIQLPEIPLEACSLFLRSESELAVNCLRALQGRESSVFLWDRHKKRFEVDSQIQTLHFSAKAMRRGLDWFGRYGSSSRRVMEWTSAIMDLSGKRELSEIYGRPSGHKNHICSTLTAAAQSLQTQLNALLRPIVEMEERVDMQKLTLIHLRCITVPTARRIRLVATVAQQIQNLDGKELAPGEKSKAILDLLYDLVHVDALLGGAYYQSMREIAWIVFLDSLTPLLAQMTSWLFLGDLSSISEDFFISTRPAKSSEDSDFWFDSFSLKESVCPKFLASASSLIHDGGKALQLMRSQEYGQQFQDFGINQSVKTGRLESLVHNQWTSHFLQESLKTYLISFTQRNSRNEKITDGPSIGQKMALAASFKDAHWTMLQPGTESIPWVYLSEEDPDTPSNSLAPGAPTDGVTARVTQTAATEETEMEDDSNLPESYLSVLKAIRTLSHDFHASLVERKHDPRSTLSRVLPNPTGRQSYTQIKDRILKSTPFGMNPIPEGATRRQEVKSSPIHSIPIDVILRKGLIDILQQRSLKIVQAFIGSLLSDLGLMDEMMILKNIFLTASPAMSEWMRRFSEQLIHGHRITDLLEFQIMMDMQECFHSCHVGEALPDCGDNEFEALFFDMRQPEWQPEECLWSERSPEELQNCALLYPLNWPLCLIVNEPRLKRYNAVFLFLLKLRWTHCAANGNAMHLKRLQDRISDDQLYPYRHLTNWKTVYKTAQEMTHFVQCLRHHVLEHIHSTFDNFCKGIVKVESVSELLREHDIALDAITRFSFQSRKKQWKTLQSRILSVFRWVLNFCSVWKTVEETEKSDRKRIDHLLEALERVTGEYQEARSSAMMLLEIYSNSLGGENELRHLMRQLDFNERHEAMLS